MQSIGYFKKIPAKRYCNHTDEVKKEGKRIIRLYLPAINILTPVREARRVVYRERAVRSAESVFRVRPKDFEEAARAVD